MSAPIQVLAIRRLDGKSTVKAFVDIRLGGVTIKGCKIVRQEGQKAWLAMPSVKTDRAWQNVVELTKPLRERATEAARAAWATHQPARQAVLEATPVNRDRSEWNADPGQHGRPGSPLSFDDEAPF